MDEGEEKTRWWNRGLSDVPRGAESQEDKDAFFCFKLSA